MKYENKTKRKTWFETQRRLADLWTNCDTWEEFSLKASCDIPEASRHDLRTCRLYWFKKTHPIAYMFSLVGTLVGSGAAFGFAFLCASGFSASPQSSALVGFFGSMIAFLAHVFMHWDFMSTLAWYEERSPIKDCSVRFRFYRDVC